MFYFALLHIGCQNTSSLVAFLTFILKLISVRSLIQNLLTCIFCCNWVLLDIAVVPVVTAQYIFGIEKGNKIFVLLKGQLFIYFCYL